MSRPLLRLAVASALAGLAVVAAVYDFSTREQAEAEAAQGPAAPAPDGPVEFPGYPGARSVRLAGEISSNGKPLRTSYFHTADAPEEVIRFHREHFRGRRVDLLESAVPGGRLLSVLDNHHGTQLLVTARQAGEERTEVIRSTSPLGQGFAQVEPPPYLPLPDELFIASKIEDRVGDQEVITLAGYSTRPAAELAAELVARFEAAGYGGGALQDGAAEPVAASAPAQRSLQWHRDELVVTAAILAAPAGSQLTLRVQREAP